MKTKLYFLFFNILLAVPVFSAPSQRLYINQPIADLSALIAQEETADRFLHEIEINNIDGLTSDIRFSAILDEKRAHETFHVLSGGSRAALDTWVAEMDVKEGKFLDIEIYHSGGIPIYYGIFRETPGRDWDSLLVTEMTETEFQLQLAAQRANNYHPVDFEASPGSGETRFTCLWVRDFRQPMTHLFYGLTHEDLVLLESTYEGQVIDQERFLSTHHGGAARHALLIAQTDNHEETIASGMTETLLNSLFSSYSDLILADLDFYYDLTEREYRYNAVWINDYPREVDVSGMSTIPGAVIDTPVRAFLLASDFEDASTFDLINDVTGRIGFVIRHLGTNEVVKYRGDESFYWASTTKTFMHVRLWQEVEAGNVTAATTVRYNTKADPIAPWFVDERPFPGLGNGQLNRDRFGIGRISDAGEDISIMRLDQAIMQVSDNAATGMLLDSDAVSLSFDADPTLNEWIAQQPGLGNRVGIMTSIRRNDPLQLWQGQVYESPAEPSLLSLPPFLACILRRYGTDETVEGTLMADRIGAFYDGTVPAPNGDVGGPRLMRMNLNSGTPEAYAWFLDRFYKDQYLSPAFTQQALEVMRVGANGSPFGSSLDNFSSFPRDTVTVYGKGGNLGSLSGSLAVADIAIFEFGDEAIAVTCFAEDVQDLSNVLTTRDARNRVRGGGQINGQNFEGIFSEIAYYGALGLARDITFTDVNPAIDSTSSISLASSAAGIGEATSAQVDIVNQGGKPTEPFQVNFYLSLDQTLDPTVDQLLDSVEVVGGLSGGEVRTITAQFTVPNLTQGNYEFFVEIDPIEGSPLPTGSINEFDESNNTAFASSGQFEILPPPWDLTFSQYFLPSRLTSTSGFTISAAESGETVTAFTEVINQSGKVLTQSFGVNFYLSADQTLNLFDDRLIGSFEVSDGLQPSQTRRVEASFAVPDLPPADYNLLVVIDPITVISSSFGDIPEFDETNNFAIAISKLQITPSSRIEFRGAPEGGDFDRLDTSSYSNGGSLYLDFSLDSPLPGQTWTLYSGPERGIFDLVEATGLPSGLTAVTDQAGDDFNIRLVFEGNYAELAALHGESTAIEDAGIDHDEDGIPTGIELVAGTDAHNPASYFALQVSQFRVDSVDYPSVHFDRSNSITLLEDKLDMLYSFDLSTWGTCLLAHSSDPLPSSDLRTDIYRLTIPSDDISKAFFRLELSPKSPPLEWNRETIAIAEGSTRTSIAVDPYCMPHIAFVENGDVYLASFDGSNWSTQFVADDPSPYRWVSLAFNPVTGLPAIAMTRQFGGELHFAELLDGAWVKSLVDDEADGGITKTGLYCSLAFDEEGNPGIAYQGGGTFNEILRYAFRENHIWNLETVEQPGRPGLYASLAFGPDNQPAIAYSKYLWSGEELLYFARKLPDATWEVFEDFSPITNITGTSLVFNPVTGHPSIATGSSDGTVVVTYDETSWSSSNVDSDIVGRAGYSLAFNSLGQPAVAYQGNAGLRYRSFDGTSWSAEIADPNGSTGYDPSLIFDHLDRPIIVYRTSGSTSPLTVARKIQAP